MFKKSQKFLRGRGIRHKLTAVLMSLVIAVVGWSVPELPVHAADLSLVKSGGKVELHIPKSYGCAKVFKANRTGGGDYGKGSGYFIRISPYYDGNNNQSCYLQVQKTPVEKDGCYCYECVSPSSNSSKILVFSAYDSAGKTPGSVSTCEATGIKYNDLGGVVSIVKSHLNLGSHSWGSWTMDKAATCMAPGSKHRTCSRCNATETESIAQLSHNSNGYVAPTCTSAGYYYCTGCNTTMSTVGALGHDWVNEIGNASYLYSAATCTANAKYYQRCSRCGTAGGSIGEQPGSMLPHPWDNGVIIKEPTVYDEGIRRFTCTKCSKIDDKSIPHKKWNIFIGEDRVQKIYVGTTKIYDMYAGERTLVVDHDR